MFKWFKEYKEKREFNRRIVAARKREKEELRRREREEALKRAEEERRREVEHQAYLARIRAASDKLLNLDYKTATVAQVRELLRQGADIDVMEGGNASWEQTPIVKAARAGNMAVFFDLIKLGANLSPHDLSYDADRAYREHCEKGELWHSTPYERWLVKNIGFFKRFHRERLAKRKRPATREEIRNGWDDHGYYYVDKYPVRTLIPAVNKTRQSYKMSDGTVWTLGFPNQENPEETRAAEERYQIARRREMAKWRAWDKAHSRIRQDAIAELRIARTLSDKDERKRRMRAVIQNYKMRMANRPINGVISYSYFGDTDVHPAGEYHPRSGRRY